MLKGEISKLIDQYNSIAIDWRSDIDNEYLRGVKDGYYFTIVQLQEVYGFELKENGIILDMGRWSEVIKW